MKADDGLHKGETSAIGGFVVGAGHIYNIISLFIENLAVGGATSLQVQ